MSYTPNNAWDNSPQTGLAKNPGPFLAEVMKNDDPLYSGRLLVYIPDFGGDPEQESSWHLVRYMTPYYGIQPMSNRLTPPTEPTTLESYGMWMTPPDLGVKVLVMFMNGDRSKGVWMGCLPEIGSHGAIPGNDKGDFDVFENQSEANNNIQNIPRPEHSTAPTFTAQGLENDALRGKTITTSSLRESPSKVFGMNTPSGHSFFMDDGDSSGANKMVRMRTAAGNMLMMNDDTGFVYVINASGSGWIEISPNGHIDVYGDSGINLATKGDINMHADGNINMHARQNVKAVAENELKVQGTKRGKIYGGRLEISGANSLDIHTCGEFRLTGNKGFQFKSGAEMILEGRCFKWNSGGAAEASQVSPELPSEITGYNSTVDRAPNNEPWPGHDTSRSAERDDLQNTTNTGSSLPNTVNNSATNNLPNAFEGVASSNESNSLSLGDFADNVEVDFIPDVSAANPGTNGVLGEITEALSNGVSSAVNTILPTQLITNAIKINIPTLGSAEQLLDKLAEPLTSLSLDNINLGKTFNTIQKELNLDNINLGGIESLSNLRQATRNIPGISGLEDIISQRDFTGVLENLANNGIKEITDLANLPVDNILGSLPISFPIGGNINLPLPDFGNAVAEASQSLPEMFSQSSSSSLPVPSAALFAPQSSTGANCGVPISRGPRMGNVDQQPIAFPTTDLFEESIGSVGNSGVSSSDSLIEMLKGFEGYGDKVSPRLGARSDVRPYWDIHQWSIGFGSYAGSRDRNNMPDLIWSPENAEDELRRQLVSFQQNVQTINSRGNYQWTPEQIDALVCFAYNIGSIDQLTANASRSNREIAEAMMLYNRAGGRTSQGLTARRRIEQEKFLNGTPSNRLDYRPGIS